MRAAQIEQSGSARVGDFPEPRPQSGEVAIGIEARWRLSTSRWKSSAGTGVKVQVLPGLEEETVWRP